MASETTPSTPTSSQPVESEEKAKAVEEKPSASSGPTAPQEAPRVEVSASTITRMMGIASTNDLRLLEGRIDVLTSKVATLLSKVERVLSMYNNLPSSTDLDRLEIQVSTVKSMVRDLAENVENALKTGAVNDKPAATDRSQKN